MIFKRTKEKPDITLEKRAEKNRLAVLGLLNELAATGNENMEKWQVEIRGMKHGPAR